MFFSQDIVSKKQLNKENIKDEDYRMKTFENFIKKSPLWLSEIPDKINGLKYSLIDTSGYNLYTFFDCESKAYHTLPDSGKHTVYQVMYNLQNHEMRIIKYTKNF